MDLASVRQQYLDAAAVYNQGLDKFRTSMQTAQGNLVAEQAATRSFRDADFTFDHMVRAINFPANAISDVNALLDADRLAIAALDKADQATDDAAYQTDMEAFTSPDSAGGNAGDRIRRDIGLPAST
ncbi:MAG: hypothetical protein ACYDAC_05820 [Candidatus Dormibacteria bacterium]